MLLIRFSDIMPMVMMMSMAKPKNEPEYRQKELLKVLNEQEEKIQKMLEEQNSKKQKEDAKARNQALMERLFQIEEGLLNQDQNRFSRNQNKKVDFSELLKAQQLYQKHLIDTLITIKKKPKKNKTQPVVYMPIPIRDPTLLPPDEKELAAQARVGNLGEPDSKKFGEMWQQGNRMSASRINPNRPEFENSQSRPMSKRSISVQRQPNLMPNPLVPSLAQSKRPQMKMYSMGTAPGQPMMPMAPKVSLSQGMNQEGMLLPDYMKPNVLRIYTKKKKPERGLVSRIRSEPRVGLSFIPKMRKYGYVVLFFKKLYLNQAKANMRYKKEARLTYEENHERFYVKTVRFLRQSLIEVLDQLWSLEQPLSFTRRKKIYTLYDVDPNTMSPAHWETTYEIVKDIMEGLNKFLNQQHLDPEICNFFGEYCCDRAFLKDGHYVESMLDRLEFDRYEALA